MAHPIDFSRHFISLREASGQPFAHRVLHPWMDRRPVPLADPGGRYARLLAASAEPRLAYVHIPFCANHCLFCGFYRNKSNDAAMETYVDYVIREIAQDAARPGVADRPIAAIFLGGGTPSALAADDLHRLLSALHRHLPLAPDCEVTVEGRVAGFDAEKIDACLAAGANRFSLGIQSFDTALRRRMGRKASETEATEFLAGLVARERAAIVCDLIYGLPGQTDDIWARDVSLCDDIGLDGVDLYCLTLQPDSPLALSIAKGSLPPSANDGIAELRYRLGDATLAARGWMRLSQAHWGRTAKERNIYNRATKRGVDCLAFGAGAGGMLQGHRFMLDADIGAYQERVDAGEKPIMAMLAPSPHHAARGFVMDALERGEIDLAALEACVEPGFAVALRPLFRNWSEVGLVSQSGTKLTLTPRGRYWHNNLAAVLFQLIGAYVDGASPLPEMPGGRPGVGSHPRDLPLTHPNTGHPHAARPHH